MSVLYSLRDVTVRYGSRTVLAVNELDIHAGEVLAVVGPSGAGKSTLLRLLNFLQPPTTGAITFEGMSFSAGRDVPLAVRRRVTTVFQRPVLLKRTVESNVAYGLRARKRRERPTEAEIGRRVNRLLDLIQLPDIGGRYPNQLSGGQRQRVALARALAIEPRMLLLDEPFGALDAKVRKELRQGLREIHDRTGITSVFVTHDQEEAMELADLVVVMSMGRIEQAGKPAEIRVRPATAFVREFIAA